MVTSLIDCDVKITKRMDLNTTQWVGRVGRIVTLFISPKGEPRYTVMFEDEAAGTGKITNFYGSEFVIVLTGDG